MTRVKKKAKKKLFWDARLLLVFDACSRAFFQSLVQSFKEFSKKEKKDKLHLHLSINYYT